MSKALRAGSTGMETVTSLQNAPAQLAQDVLFVGMTRPATKFGVTFSALLLNGVVTLQVFLFSGNLLLLLLFLPVHGICSLLCARDARIFDLLVLWVRTGMGGLPHNRARWGCASYSPSVLDPVRPGGGRRLCALGCVVHRSCGTHR